MRSFFLFLCAAAASVSVFSQATNIMVEAALHHLGTNTVAGFPAAHRKPGVERMERAFEAQANAQEWTLRLTQQNVTDDWGVEINGRRVARLNVSGGVKQAHFPIPPGTLVDGTNQLVIVPRNPKDDILVGLIEVIPQRMKDFLSLGHLTVTVTDRSGRTPMPARVTVASPDNKLAEIYNVQPTTAAWRKGMFYTTGAPVEFDLPEGEWIVSATRGMEWGRTQVRVKVFLGQQNRLILPIGVEVDTRDFIAADTHLHTYTFSGHGDASLDDRLYSLAGEGVEMAVATDHNHFTDYKPRQKELGVSPFFTSVIGNEVTTANGHFNAFPFKLDAIKPNHKETNWVKLVEDIRARGAQYVVLNHPRWPTITNSPFAKWGVNRVDGTRTNEVTFTVDAMEVVNSTVPLKDPDYLLRDWFALWNRGERVWGVGSSDTHNIGDPPGQGRTYVASSARDVASIDVDAAIKAMQAGDMSVSYGIFGHAIGNGKTRMGQTMPAKGEVEVKFHVACPSWIPAKRAVLYLNGINMAEQKLEMAPRTPLATNVIFKIAAPAHDAHLVCVAYGDGVKDPSWKTIHDYTLAVTNPIFLDADGNGKYSSPRETAVELLKKIQPLTLEKLEDAVTKVDAAIAVQIATEAKLRLPTQELAGVEKLLETLSEKFTR